LNISWCWLGQAIRCHRWSYKIHKASGWWADYLRSNIFEEIINNVETSIIAMLQPAPQAKLNLKKSRTWDLGIICVALVVPLCILAAKVFRFLVREK